MSERYLVTGAMGCIGAWTLYHLRQQGKQAVSFDLSANRQRLDLLLSAEEQDTITFVQGDLTDAQQVRTVVEDHDITHVIHLGALQVPMCKADPIMGAQVNVTGTVNVFEAVRHAGLQHLSYASSIAVYGPRELYENTLLSDDAPMLPRTLYGVYKVANEQLAQVYWHDQGISSTALRPYTVYGLGRDQGLTSEPTKAMFASARGEDYHISFGGKMQFHYASDVALQFIDASEQALDGAYGFNLGTPPVAVETVTEIIMEIVPDVQITVGEGSVPFPDGFDDSALRNAFTAIYETPLRDAIQATIQAFQQRA
ncbi:MAG: NAD-dependent epimerase/dehydratase family protein [Anaerolineae bacterium]